MKANHIAIAIVGGVSVLLSSCHHYVGVHGGGYYAPGVSWSSSVAWTDASYDANGFPIFGYEYGRPVYGYTAAGAAIFTFAALTASCYVPHWHPAPWYKGHWHYPSHCHRVHVPPRYPQTHRPHKRPSGGMHAPIHKDPGKHFGGKPHGHHSSHVSKPDHRPSRPSHDAKPGVHRPNTVTRPSHNAKPGVQRPSTVTRPSHSAKPGVQRPSTVTRPSHSAKPGVQRPSTVTRPSHSARPSVSRPSTVSRPSHSARPSVSRPSTVSRPSSASRPSGGRPSSGHHRSR